MKLKKSQVAPSRRSKILGFVIDSVKMIIRLITQKKPLKTLN